MSLYLQLNEIVKLSNALKVVNQDLWEIEDSLRYKEQILQFDDEFIALARSVYMKNYERAQLKYKINITNHSFLLEVKSYSELLL